LIQFFEKNIPVLGRVRIGPYLSECVDAGEPSMGKYPHSQAAEADELIAGKISEGTQWKVHSGQP
jgi:hypothetical protein